MPVTDTREILNPVIYIVDPDSKLTANLLTLFERTGYEAVSYPSAEAFLETEPNPARIGCVVSEMKLPGADGLELLTALRERNSRLPLIILTGDPDVSQAVIALRKKVSDYLVKPVIERDLIRRIKVVLRGVRDSQSKAQDSRLN
jgi:FixJ family two-component response regulator